MKSKVNWIVAPMLIIVCSLITIYFFRDDKSSNVLSSSKSTKGYEINKVGKEIKCFATSTNDKNYKFSTYVQLGVEDEVFPSIIKLDFNSNIDLNNETNNYKLSNAKLEITPIGSHQFSKGQEFITDSEYSCNYEFGMKSNEVFDQDMEVGIAKLLFENSSIKVNSVISKNNNHKINTFEDLVTTKGNAEIVTANYKNINNFFSCWYNIKVKCIAANEIIISVY